MQLPPDLRRTAVNMSKIRLGVIAFALIMPIGIVNKAAASTPAEFLDFLFSFTPIAGILAVVAAGVILYLRATRTSPTFVAAYKEVMPGFVDRIEERYGTPGLGDVFAPWVRGRTNFLKSALGRLANRFSLKP